MRRFNPINTNLVLIGRDGHLKLSDFGLSTGFHKTHDSSYYLKFKDPKSGVNDLNENIDLTLSRFASISIIDDSKYFVRKESTIATWKKNRRNLAYSTVGTPDYIAPEGTTFIKKSLK